MGDDGDARRLADLHHACLEREVQLERRPVATFGLVRERALDHRADGRRHVGRQWGGERAARQLVQRRDLVRSVVGGNTREELVENGAERPDVGAMIDVASEGLLRRHVADLALELARARLLRDAVACLRDAEIDEHRRARVRDEDVLWRDVAMDDAQQRAIALPEDVRRVEARSGVGADTERDARGDALLLLLCGAHYLGERVAVDPLHDDEGALLLLADVDDARDVAVLDARGNARFVDEHLLEARILRVLGQDHLHDDEALESLSAAETGEPHRGHAAVRQRAQQLVPVETVTRLELSRIHIPWGKSIVHPAAQARRTRAARFGR